MLKSSMSRLAEGDGNRNTDKRRIHSETPGAGHPYRLYFLISSKARNSDAPPLLQWRITIIVRRHLVRCGFPKNNTSAVWWEVLALVL